MATCNSVCALCDLRQQTSTSTHWCIECEDPLCSDCREHHNVLTATRYHKTILISDYQSLPTHATVGTNINQNCVDHWEIYQFYCSKHESPICNKCVKDHGKCGEILPLDERVKDIKTSESFVDMEQSLDDLSTFIKKISKDKKSNIKSITEQKKKLSAQVCLLKQQVIQHVNKLEEEFIKELDQIEFGSCDPIRSILFSLHSKEKFIIQKKSEIKNTKKYASNLQAFLRMKEIQKKTTKYEKHIQSSIENNHHKNIESAINTKILDILMIDTFGSIKITKSPSSDINLNRRKDRQAQMMIPKKKVLITDIKLVVQRELKSTCNYLNGCCITKSGIILFTNDNGTLNAVNAEGKVENVIYLENQYDAFDVADLDDLTVALSTGYSPRPVILIVKLTTCREKKYIDLPGIAFGITYDGNSLICCVKDKELHVISLIDYRISTISNTVSRQYAYVSTHGDKIFFTNPDECKVTCCLYSGFLVWEFTDKSILKGPRGITIDNKGNVFVVGRESCNVVVISPDGKLCKQILAKEDGLEKPTAIFFDKVRRQLLVTIKTQFVNVYNVSYV